MIVTGLKTERFHNYQEGDCGKPIDRKGIHLRFYKKGFYKRYDRKKSIKNTLKQLSKDDY